MSERKTLAVQKKTSVNLIHSSLRTQDFLTFEDWSEDQKKDAYDI